MVSRFRYFSFKAAPKSDRVPFLAIPLFVVVIVALNVGTAVVLFLIAAAYVLSGPMLTLWGMRRVRAARGVRADEPRNPDPPAV
jgi:CDP-diacylglycerol--serine O-phosphatidyltransferase